MGISFTIHPNGEYVLIKSQGDRKNAKELMEGTEMLYQNIQESGAKFVLVDYSEVNFNIKLPDVFNIVRFYDRKLPEIKDITLATIIKQETMELGNYWEKVSSKKSYNFKVFTDHKKARNWIKQEVAKNK